MAARRSPVRLAVLIAAGLVLVLGVATYVIVTPSDEYVLLPDTPHPAAAIVTVKGEAPRTDAHGPGIYYLDVLVHRATIGETWLAPLQGDAQRVNANQIVPQGGSQRDVNRLDRLDVQSSKRLAALVALRALGRKVPATGGGVRVDEVDSAPARAGGLAPGMVVTSVNGKPVASLTTLRKILAQGKVGDTVTLGVLDGTRHRTITTTLIKAPKDPRAPNAPVRAVVGIIGENVAPNIKLPFPIKIDTGNLGGPSAGLAFALEIYNSLTGRKLTKGRRVAVTGEIDSDGNVGPVGGVTGKTIGARRAGFDLMLVPIENVAEARANAGSNLRVVGVRTFADALRALRG
jgi:PDZ domain-containing protein